MKNFQPSFIVPVEVGPNLQIVQCWMIQRLHDGGEHDGDGTGAHLRDLANGGEQEAVTAIEDVLSETGWNILYPGPQCSLHRFWNINTLEL